MSESRRNADAGGPDDRTLEAGGEGEDRERRQEKGGDRGFTNAPAAAGADGAQEDLAFVRRMMEESRGAIYSGRGHGVLWGTIIFAALLVAWLEGTRGVGVPDRWLWPVAIGLGWLGSVWIGIREERRARVRSPTGLVLAGIWAGCGGACTVIGFGGTITGTLATNGAILAPVGAVIGAAYLASSFVYRSGRWRWLAAGWWAGTVALFAWPGPEALLVMAGLVLTLQLAPMLLLPRTLAGAAQTTR